MFFVLVEAVLGVQAFAAFPLWLNGAFVTAIAVFTWRAYNSLMSYGWV
jgi:hypothetical protein